MSPGAGPQSPGRLCRSHGHSEISLWELSCFAPFLCSVSAGRSRAGEALPEMPSLPLMCRKKHFERDLQYRPEPMASTAARPTLYARCIRDEFILAGVGCGACRSDSQSPSLYLFTPAPPWLQQLLAWWGLPWD